MVPMVLCTLIALDQNDIYNTYTYSAYLCNEYDAKSWPYAGYKTFQSSWVYLCTL